jgi:hypothetical protein
MTSFLFGRFEWIKMLALFASFPTKKATHNKGQEYIIGPFTYTIKPSLRIKSRSMINRVQSPSLRIGLHVIRSRADTSSHTRTHTPCPLSPSVVAEPSTCSLGSSDFRTNQSSWRWPFTNRKHVESATRTAVQRRPISPSLLFPFFSYSSDRLKYTTRSTNGF